jgi:hypothetical protein
MTRKVKDFLGKYPRFVFLVTGLCAGFLVSAITISQSDKTVSRLEEMLDETKEEYRSYVKETTITINSLRIENKKLKSKTSTVKIVKPDGTIEERTISETESEQSISESVQKEYKEQIAEEIKKTEERLFKKLETITKERKKLTIAGGYTSSLAYYGSISYRVLPPFSIQAAAYSNNSFSLGVGLDL